MKKLLALAVTIGISTPAAAICIPPFCSTTAVLPLSGNTYRVTSSVDSGLGGYTAAEQEAVLGASNYCQATGRKLVVKMIQNTSSLAFGNAAVTFRCLSPKDPALNAETYRPMPDYIIEHRITHGD